MVAQVDNAGGEHAWWLAAALDAKIKALRSSSRKNGQLFSEVVLYVSFVGKRFHNCPAANTLTTGAMRRTAPSEQANVKGSNR